MLLAPAVVLAILLLLGFAGCHEVFGLEFVGIVTIEARVPSQFTIVEARLLWIRPGSSVTESTRTPARSDESPDTVLLSHTVGRADAGSWRVTCRLHLQDTTKAAEDAAANEFVLPSESSATVRFETSGRPDTDDFRVVPGTVVFHSHD